jgi:LysR family transcriptional regulator, regulator for genes of the gallate degradation pathway
LTQSLQAVTSCPYNLRHLRMFLAVVDTGSVTKAAQICHLSQPAVTQALAKMEHQADVELLRRTPQGLFASPAGDALYLRITRAFALIDPALTEISPRLIRTATMAQLQALVAVREMENFTLAARQLGLAQPTIHRSITQLEREAGRPLFERTAYGILATREVQTLAQATRLAFAELAQADADLADITNRDAGRIVIGAMPLSRSYVLPNTIAAFRQMRPNLPIHVIEGPYNDLLAGLRRGDIDVLIGALRHPSPIADIEQKPMFEDQLVLLCGANHPLALCQEISAGHLAAYPWVVPPVDTPARIHFERLFADAGKAAPKRIIETSSFILMRELLDRSEHLGCTSALQAEADIARGLLKALPLDMRFTARPIGLTLRKDWLPTDAQRQFLAVLIDQTVPLQPKTVSKHE